ncbi:hypothetical protein [Stenotrophomonas sp.]|uniref:hypothetical protein n=1 Tax=Stenotrophomonas sp. TaxID=69392 RepID=UPI00289BDFF2|nr:hypothetical protein [Stenotrophomonas sp.]
MQGHGAAEVATRTTQAAVLVSVLLAASAHAQQPPDTPPVEPPPTVPGTPPANDDNVTTLGEVRAVKPEDEPLDLYRFKNPVEPAPNRFSRTWSEPPSVEQVSLSGGYLMMGINAALGAAGKGIHKLTGGPDQIQSAIARPPPELTEDQQQRALQNQDGPP